MKEQDSIQPDSVLQEPVTELQLLALRHKVPSLLLLLPLHRLVAHPDPSHPVPPVLIPQVHFFFLPPSSLLRSCSPYLLLLPIAFVLLTGFQRDKELVMAIKRDLGMKGLEEEA